MLMPLALPKSWSRRGFSQAMKRVQRSTWQRVVDWFLVASLLRDELRTFLRGEMCVPVALPQYGLVGLGRETNLRWGLSWVKKRRWGDSPKVLRAVCVAPGFSTPGRSRSIEMGRAWHRTWKSAAHGVCRWQLASVLSSHTRNSVNKRNFEGTTGKNSYYTTPQLVGLNKFFFQFFRGFIFSRI